MSEPGADPFGRTGDGAPVTRTVIGNGKLTAKILDWGAVIQDLRLAGHDAPLVLGYRDFAPYEANPPFFGAVVGRYGNRIRHGRFAIDGERFETERNYIGKHQLHGGFKGFARQHWTVGGQGDNFIELALHDPAGAAGFPGSLDLRCTYRVAGAATLRMEIEATSDAPTLCNPAQHSYFNLDDGGKGDVFNHRLTIAAGGYTPVDEELIPTGEVLPVEGTRFDFLQARTIRLSEGPAGGMFDHNFCLRADRGPLRQAAWAQGTVSGVEMELWTTEPGLQFYSGQYIRQDGIGLVGATYKPSTGFCLEPQVWPDSPNRSYFPQAVLRPGETYRQVTEWRFRLP